MNSIDARIARNGNPRTENLVGAIGALQTETGMHPEVRAVADAA
jgi:hypothetical protein